ncbi:hypothetical protein [Azohydromonas aeria]|uniref:hypothetical protein n=1 Tax=Azohydromonas aeria TaxID=2590212 RepID=UPI0012FAA9EF|nr:hypothetical protein [Azohydromonas aeria]
MSNPLVQTWAAAVLAGKENAAFQAWLDLIKCQRLAEAGHFVQHSSRADKLEPTLLRELCIGPMRDESRFGLGFGFQLRLQTVSGLQAGHWNKLFQAWRMTALRYGISLVAQGGDQLLSLELQTMFLHDRLQMLVTLDECYAQVLQANGVHPDPRVCACADHGVASVQTLWVIAPAPGEVFKARLKPEVVEHFGASVKTHLESLWKQEVERFMAAAPASLAPGDPLRLAAMRDELLQGIELSNPLEPYAAWRRQQLHSALNELWGPPRGRSRHHAPLLFVADRRPHKRTRLVAWRLEDPLVADHMPARSALRHASFEKPILRAPTGGMATQHQPDAEASQEPLFPVPSRPQFLAAPTLPRALGERELGLDLGAQELDWLRQWAKELPGTVGLWVCAQQLEPELMAAPPASLAAMVRTGQAAAVNALAGAEAGPDPAQAVPCSRAQAYFGTQGALLVEDVDAWHKVQPEHFYGGARSAGEATPAIALSRGMATWTREALSSRGRALLSTLLSSASPVTLSNDHALGQALAQLAPQDAMALAELLSSSLAQALTQPEFLWCVAFALDSAQHALVEVRPALQDRLLQTDVSDDVPAWTLRGPAPLSYLHYATPIALVQQPGDPSSPGTKTLGARLSGAYVWTRETEAGMQVAVGLDLLRQTATRYPTTRAGSSTTDTVGYRSVRGFIAYRWEGLSPDASLGSLLLEMARRHAHPQTSGRNTGERMDDIDQAALAAALKHIVLVMLYMGLKDARLTREAKHYSANAGRGENPVLRSKSAVHTSKEQPGLLHRIRVGPEHFDDEPSDMAAGHPGTPGRKMAVHWRRGHFRMQPFGPGRRERRQTWIRPSLVAGHQLSTDVPVRSYDVR